jgi:FkbM family methyltransferase
MRFMLDFLRPGDSFVDIGANVGVYTLLAATIPTVRVWAFEPSTEAYGRLLENGVLTDLVERVHTERKAVAADKSAGFITTGLDTINRLTDGSDQTTSELVEIVPLDDSVPSTATRSIRLIKIDVEGDELAVLRGATVTIEQSLPVFIIERNNAEEVASFLAQYGYRPYTYDPVDRRIFPVEVNAALQNLIFIASEGQAAQRAQDLTAL